LGELN